MSTTARSRWDGWTEPEEPGWVHDVNPIMPVDLLAPESKCPHEGPIEPGSLDYCVVCHASGRDGSRALRIDRRKAPKPEPKSPGPGPTRRQKRAEKFARSA